MSREFQGRLYFFYSRGAKLAFGVKRRITLLGWMMFAAFPMACFMGMKFPRESFFQLMALVGAVLVVSLFGLFVRRASLSAVRSVPAYATAGQLLSYSVQFTNRGAMKLTNFLVCEQAPDPTPSKELFLNSTEPGEEKRNSFDRKFIAYRWMWMMRRRLLLKSEDLLAVPIAAGESEKIRVEFTPIRRGIIVLDNLQVVLPDPIGLFQRLVKVTQEADTVIVLPKRYSFQGMDLAGESKNQVGGDASSSVAGQSGEFVSLREYRPGDPLKHIHWPSWGKIGKPVIKVYEDQFFPRYGLVLDTFVGLEKEEVFEVAVSLAATFASAVDTQQSLLDLMFVQQGAQIHRVGKNVGKVDSMLEVLASIDMEDAPDWQGLGNMVLKHADDMSTCIVVLCSWCDERAAFLERVSVSGVDLCVLHVVESDADAISPPANFYFQNVLVHQVEAALAQLSEI